MRIVNKKADSTPQVVNLPGDHIKVGSVFTSKSDPEALLLRTYTAVVDLVDPNLTWGLSKMWVDVKFKNAHIVVEE